MAENMSKLQEDRGHLERVVRETAGEVAERGLDAVNWLALQLVDVDSDARQRSRSVTTPTALPKLIELLPYPQPASSARS